MTTRAINVQNGANTPSTTAQILIENKIDYTPKVSVIIPVYNVEKYLRQCLDSVVAQTLKEIEIICVDDGSTDSSLEILKEYAIKDPRFTIITQENLYAGIARNAGLSIAKGEYIWFIDSDDFIEQDAIELICNNNSDIILIGYRNITNNKITENKHHCLLDYPLHKNIRKNAFKAQATIWCKIYKRDFILKQNIRFDNYKVCNDVYFAYYSMIIAESITTVPHCLYNYRKDATGALSRSRGNNSETIALAFNNIKNKLQQNNQFKAYKKYFYKRYMQHITYELKSCNNISQKIKLLQNLSFCEKTKYLFYRLKKYFFHIKNKDNELKITILGIKTKIKNPFTVVKDYKYYKNLSPKDYKQELKEWYYKETGKELNLDNPLTFNEKIQWLKLYDSTPIKTELADKYMVREHIKKTIGEEYLVPLLGVWDKFDDIDFDKLPNQFVLKCNHGSGYNIIVKNKQDLNLKKTKRKITKWLKQNFAFKNGFELHYKNIKPKIIAEEFTYPLEDYKFYCYNGKCKHILHKTEKNNKAEYCNFDMEFNCLPLSPKSTIKPIVAPKNFNKMLSLAEKISKNFNFVRVDFYLSNERILFSELTFTPSSGANSYTNEWDEKLGQFLTINLKDIK